MFATSTPIEPNPITPNVLPGNSNPTNLNIYIESLEKALNKKAIRENMPMQMGDVVATASDSSLLEDWIKYKPSTTIESGIHQFVKWYKSFYNIV